MQAYLNYPEVKNRIMRLIHEEHEGLPPIKRPSDLAIQIDIPGSAPITWPGAPASRGGLDYEGQLGIPMTVAVVAEAVWASAGAAYADTWPARFFGTIQVGQDLAAVGWQWLYWLLTSQSSPGVINTAWETMGEQLLALLAAAPQSQ